MPAFLVSKKLEKHQNQRAIKKIKIPCQSILKNLTEKTKRHEIKYQNKATDNSVEVKMPVF